MSTLTIGYLKGMRIRIQYATLYIAQDGNYKTTRRKKTLPDQNSTWQGVPFFSKAFRSSSPFSRKKPSSRAHCMPYFL